jgi:uncharacterized protein (DUF4415 family)
MSGKLTRMRLGEGLDQDRTDWARVDALTDEQITQAIRNDPDSIEATPEWFERALILRASRPKERLTVRFDADVVDWFRAQGGGYQTRMNAVLRAYYEHARKTGR